MIVTLVMIVAIAVPSDDLAIVKRSAIEASADRRGIREIGCSKSAGIRVSSDPEPVSQQVCVERWEMNVIRMMQWPNGPGSGCC